MIAAGAASPAVCTMDVPMGPKEEAHRYIDYVNWRARRGPG